MEKPANKFNKAQEDRRKSFIEDDIGVAEDVVSEDTVEDIEEKQATEGQEAGSLKAIINEQKSIKTRTTVYIDADADDFYTRLGRLTDVSKSKLMSEVLTIAINTNVDIQEMAKNNKRIKKILDDYNKGFY